MIRRDLLPSALFLARRDFGAKYAGTVLGAAWALAQPAVTVGVYVLVFAVGFKSAPVAGTPYALWLVAGMAPWLFFVDALTGAALALPEYAYLVKKTRFPAVFLPFVKVASALFSHGIFVALASVVCAAAGVHFGPAVVQALYYTLCAAALALALGLLLCAVAPFLRDMAQIIAVATQVMFWLTPVAWDVSLFPQYAHILAFNPMAYVVCGYRDSFFGGGWFFEKRTSLYFWALTLLLLLAAWTLYKKLRPSFADVL